MSKTLDRYVQDGKIEGYDDERSIGNSLIVYLPSGKQWLCDPTCHTRGFDTVTEAVEAIKNDVADYPDDPELKKNQPSDTREYLDNDFPLSFGEYSVAITYEEDTDDITILSCEFDLENNIKCHLDKDSFKEIKPVLTERLEAQAELANQAMQEMGYEYQQGAAA